MKTKDGTKYRFGEPFKCGDNWFKRIIFEVSTNSDEYVVDTLRKINNPIKELNMSDATIRIFNRGYFGAGLLEVSGRVLMTEKEIAVHQEKIKRKKEKEKQNKQIKKQKKIKQLAKDAQSLGFFLITEKDVK